MAGDESQREKLPNGPESAHDPLDDITPNTDGSALTPDQSDKSPEKVLLNSAHQSRQHRRQSTKPQRCFTPLWLSEPRPADFRHSGRSSRISTLTPGWPLSR